MAERDPNDVVCLVTATNPVQAHVWKQALADAGIESRVVGDFLAAGLADGPGMRPELWVHREDVDRATEVLRQGPEGTPEAEA